MTKLIFIFGLLQLAGCSIRPKQEAQNSIETHEKQLVISKDLIDTNCVFISNNELDCWTRVNTYPLDKAAEDFSCNLRDKGINTITIAKYLGDNGAFPNETAFVLWLENDKEFLKEFYTKGETTVFEKAIRVLDWSNIRRLAQSLKMDTVRTYPELEMYMSHNIGLAVQYYSQTQYFCDRLQDHEWQGAINKNHPKVVFWRALTELLNPTTDR